MFPLQPTIRVLCLAGALCLGIGSAFGQDTDFEKRMDQKWRDAMAGKSAPYNPISKDKTVHVKEFASKSATVKDFYLPKNFQSKDYLTGSYKGNKGFWMGDFKYSTKTVDTSGRIIPNATTKYSTKDMPVKADRDASKKYTTRSFSTKESKFRGTAQDRLTKDGAAALAGSHPVGWQGNMGEMSLEQVRDLLNKNK